VERKREEYKVRGGKDAEEAKRRRRTRTNTNTKWCKLSKYNLLSFININKKQLD